MTLTDQQRRIFEKTTPVWSAYLIDENDVAIPLLQVSTLTLTFYDRRTGTVVNSRNAQDVKNASNVTLHSTTGLLTWSMQSADTTLVTPDNYEAGDAEEHVALFSWTLTNGKIGRFLTSFFIVQLTKVT